MINGMLGWSIIMTNDISSELLTKITNIDNCLSLLTNSFVVGIGVLVAIFVCYLMYKLVNNFISF